MYNIVSNLQLGRLISQLNKWSSDLKHQKHLLDGQLCFDFELCVLMKFISRYFQSLFIIDFLKNIYISLLRIMINQGLNPQES